RFRIVAHGLHDGMYQVGFFHPTLDSLGISPPTQPVLISQGKASFVQLYVPSAGTVVASVCPDSTRTEGRGLVMGIVRDASTEKPATGVRVVLMWTGVSVAGNSVLKVPQATSVLTDDMGTFRACGVPTQIVVRLQARSSKGASGWIELSVPPDGLGLRDVLLGERAPVVASAPSAPGTTAPGAASSATDSTAHKPAPLGSAVLTGRVTSTEGKPLEGAMVLLLGTQLSARSNADGAFRLIGLPAGTQSVEVREIGYSPKRFAVDLSPRRPSTLAAMLDERTTVLFRQVPGLTVAWDGQGYQIQVNRTTNAGMCPVAYYIDGAPFLSLGDDIDQIVRPEDIAAIEVYKSSAETPMQFQGSDGGPCGTIVIWTKRRVGNTGPDSSGDN